MNTFHFPQLRTRIFARVLGPLLAVGATTTLARPDIRTLLADFETTTVWPWVTGSFMLLGALVIVAMHQNWRGATAIAVSVLGWLFTVRAVFLMAFPHAFMSAANAALDVGALWVSVDILVGFLGLYLIFVGWAPELEMTAPQPKSSSLNLPRAA